MAWTLSIGGTQVQAYVRPFDSLKVRYRGYAGVGTLSCRLVEQSTYTLNITNESPVVFVDSGTTMFGGYVRRRKRTDFNTQGIRVWEIECQDYNTDPSDDWVPVGTGPRTTVEMDQARIRWLFATYGTRGVDATTAFTQNALVYNLPAMDFQGMTLAQALDEICKWTGAQWYIDQNKKLHYFLTETTNAPWNIDVQSPNGTTTFPCRDFEYPDDTIDYVNTVAVIGGGVYAVRYRGGTPPAAGTQRLYVHRDSTLSTVAQCETVGDSILSAQSNRQDGKLTVWKSGLMPGQVVHIKNTQWNLDADFRITEVVPKYIDLDKAFYDVSFGSNPVKLTDMWNKQVGELVAVTQLSEQTAGQTADTTAPATPTGLNASSVLRVDEDGTSRPYIVATWNANAESDMEAYELQMDRAAEGDTTFTLSASGTGGSLTAGTYVVKITALGAQGGETRQLNAQEKVVATGQRLYVNITSRGAAFSSYKVYCSLQAGGTDPRSNGQTTTTTGSNVEITSVGAGSVSPSYSTAVSFLNPASLRIPHPTVKTEIEDVQSGWYYAFRVRAVDTSLNKSAWSSTYGHKVIGDTDAPTIPVGLTLTPGYKVAGARWAPNSESDLAYYELRFAPEGTGAPNPDLWINVRALTTAAVVTGLELGTTYYFQVRAVDRSGNVRTSATIPTAVLADSYPEAGWSNDGTNEEYITVVPSAVPSADITFNSVITATLSATSSIDATAIRAGTLKIGGGSVLDAPDYLLVYNSSGAEIGRWDANGLLIKDPNDTNKQVVFRNGVLKFSNDGGDSGTWSTAIDAYGIKADAITLGTAPGGHNNIPNASFELSNWATILSVIWPTTYAWTATIGTNVNLNTSGGSGALTMTSATYA